MIMFSAKAILSYFSYSVILREPRLVPPVHGVKLSGSTAVYFSMEDVVWVKQSSNLRLVNRFTTERASDVVNITIRQQYTGFNIQRH